MTTFVHRRVKNLHTGAPDLQQLAHLYAPGTFSQTGGKGAIITCLRNGNISLSTAKIRPVIFHADRRRASVSGRTITDWRSWHICCGAKGIRVHFFNGGTKCFLADMQLSRL